MIIMQLICSTLASKWTRRKVPKQITGVRWRTK